jgi:hypothetical protein
MRFSLCKDRNAAAEWIKKRMAGQLNTDFTPDWPIFMRFMAILLDNAEISWKNAIRTLCCSKHQSNLACGLKTCML